MTEICIFNGDMSRGGGTERITQVLANLLCQHEEYRVHVLNWNNEKNQSYYPLDERVQWYVISKGNLIKKVYELNKFIGKKKIDIIINVDVMLGIFTLPLTLYKSSLKIISWEMFNIRNDIGSNHTQKIRKYYLKKSAYYITQTKGDMDAFKKEMPVKCPMAYIYNPCDSNINHKVYSIDSKTIVTLGHFFYTKGYDLAVEVAKHIFDKHPDWKWEFYGDGIRLEETRAIVEQYGLEKNVIFCGRTSDTDAVYKKASMYVMTSRTEGFGLVLTEAKSFNLPTLAFDVDFGPREIIENGISGYLVKDFNIKEMADHICELIENQDKRVDFARRAKDNLSKFSLKCFEQEWIRIIEEIKES